MHEMPKPIFWRKQKYISKCRLLIFPSMLSVIVNYFIFRNSNPCIQNLTYSAGSLYLGNMKTLLNIITYFKLPE